MNEIADGARRARDILAGERQSMWAVLKWSISQQFDYWLQLVYPSQVKEAAELLDDVLWEQLVGRCQGEIGGKVGNWECLLNPDVKNLKGKMFSEWVVRQPIR